MTEFGFSDEAPDRQRSPRARGLRRPTAAGIAFTVGMLALVAFGLWAWVARSHTDDLAAWKALEATFQDMDRSLTPLGHSEAPPCRDELDGVVTRTYPPSTGPQAASLIGFLTQEGWSQQPATDTSGSPSGSGANADGALARLTKSSGGRDLTIIVSGPSLNQLVGSVAGRSPGSTVGCFGR
ncbi:MAG TPA: hypothetical protein VFN43_00050 [Humibacillus sp.]|nr:hypothetical protein [Humibacillus sp.]